MLMDRIKDKMMEADLKNTPLQIIKLTHEEYNELNETGLIVQNKIYDVNIQIQKEVKST